MSKVKKRTTRKAKIRRILKQALKESYGKAGYTSTAAKFYKLFCEKLKVV